MHVRRPFFELFDSTGSPVAKHVLEEIAQLYEVEASVRGQPAQIRHQARQEKALPILTRLQEYLARTITKTSRKSPLGQAINYALTLWPALTRYCQWSAPLTLGQEIC